MWLGKDLVLTFWTPIKYTKLNSIQRFYRELSRTRHATDRQTNYEYRITSFFIAPLLKIRFSVPVKRDETAMFNPRGETLKVGLQTALSSRFTVTENQILKTVAIKNGMHYLKQNTANATRLQLLHFVPCNAIYYYVPPAHKLYKLYKLVCTLKLRVA